MEIKMIIPAICCIGYNRPNSMKRLLLSVGNAVYDDTNIPLIISIDESPDSDEVEAVARMFEWKYGEKIIFRYSKRMGLKEHCMRCSDLSIKYGALIFLEDDAVVAPGFYRYTKAAVNFYKNDKRVLAISLYAQKWSQAMVSDMTPAHNGFDTFFYQRELSHGFCWLGDGWKLFREWYETPEGQKPQYNKDVPSNVYGWNPQKSWSYYVSFYMSEKQAYFVCPYHSFATNFHELGEHSKGGTNICQTVVSESTAKDFKFAKFEEGVVYDSFFERRDIFVNHIEGVPLSQICIDLNNTKYDWTGYQFLLTIKQLPYKIVKTYGLSMLPIENNVIFGFPGKEIKLYEVPSDYIGPRSSLYIPKYPISQERLDLTLNKLPGRALLKNLVSRIIKKK